MAVCGPVPMGNGNGNENCRFREWLCQKQECVCFYALSTIMETMFMEDGMKIESHQERTVLKEHNIDSNQVIEG